MTRAAAEPTENSEVRATSEIRKQRDFLTLVAAILFTAVALGTGFVAGFQLAGGHISVNPPRISSPDTSTPFALRLRTESAGERVRVTWAKDSAAALRALGGTLYIRDGNDTRLVRLQPGEVRDGMLLHLPQTGTVQFRLELNLPGDRTVTEAVGWAK
jgi:hypothetical protein